METWTQWWPTLKCQKFIVKLQFYNEVNLLCMNPPQFVPQEDPSFIRNTLVRGMFTSLDWAVTTILWRPEIQVSDGWVNKYWCQGQELLRGRDQATALDHQRQWMWCALERDELAWWWPDPQGSWLWFFSFKNLRTEVIGSLLRSSRTWLESSWQRVVASYLSIPRPDSIYRPRIHGINPSSLKQESFPWHKVSWGNLLGNPALEKGLLYIGSELRLIPGNWKHCCGLPTRGFWG